MSEPSEGGPPWAVFIDSQITRRKRYHIVCDPDDEIRYQSMWLGECLAWLELNEIESYVLIAARGRTLGLPTRTYKVERQD